MNKFNFCDKVKVNIRNQSFDGEVVDIYNASYRTDYMIEFVNEYGNFERHWISESDLESVEIDTIKCECGGAILKHPGHSTWCVMFNQT